jgi:hypothetical protein
MEKSALEVVDSSPENVECIKRALAYLPDRARWHSTPGVRIADEIVIDLMGKACDVTYQKAQPHIQHREIRGVKIPCLRLELLIETKVSIRPKDMADRRFLEDLLSQSDDDS